MGSSGCASRLLPVNAATRGEGKASGAPAHCGGDSLWWGSWSNRIHSDLKGANIYLLWCVALALLVVYHTIMLAVS